MAKLNATHDPALLSWVLAANQPETGFPIQNLPLGFLRPKSVTCVLSTLCNLCLRVGRGESGAPGEIRTPDPLVGSKLWLNSNGLFGVAYESRNAL